MRNRAKCKKCEIVIESFHPGDYVECKCGEISVSGGEALFCAAKDWNNFVRIDDRDKEVKPKIVDDVKPLDIEVNKPNKDELVSMLQRDLENIENLPENARYQPITHYDFLSTMLLVLAVLKSDK